MTNLLQLVSVIPTLVKGVVSLYRAVKKKVKQVKYNKHQCQTLSDRIQRIVRYLEEPILLKVAEDVGTPLVETIESFHAFVVECFHFISQFCNFGSFKRFRSGSEYQQKFIDFNDRLVSYCAELSMGIKVQNFIDKQKDEIDQQNDIMDIIPRDKTPAPNGSYTKSLSSLHSNQSKFA